ncbi:serine/threonine-protein kinase HSL1,negative regulator of Swe1 kinase, partial [Trypanosoma cruzi]
MNTNNKRKKQRRAPHKRRVRGSQKRQKEHHTECGSYAVRSRPDIHKITRSTEICGFNDSSSLKMPFSNAFLSLPRVSRRTRTSRKASTSPPSSCFSPRTPHGRPGPPPAPAARVPRSRLSARAPTPPP